MTEIDVIVPLGLIAAVFIWENAIAKPAPDPANDRREFLSHVQEIRDMINRCTSMAEWSVLDQEIDWLEDTWRGRIDKALMLQETGQLYDKWFKRRDQIKHITTA